MVVFVAETEVDYEAKRFAEETQQRLDEDVGGLMFGKDSFVKYRKVEPTASWIIAHLDVMFPPKNLHGFVAVVPWIAIFMFGGLFWSWWLVFPTLVSLSYFLQTRWFYYVMFKLGLRKSGYEGSVNYVNRAFALKRFAKAYQGLQGVDER